MGSEIEATAQATQAIAETTGKAIDASRDAGGFFGRIFGPALEEWGQSWQDQMRYRRADRLMQLECAFQAKRLELGFAGPLRHLSPKIGIPLLEAASIEDDEDLFRMFATLLATATSEKSESGARRAYVTILQDLEPFDATVLLAAYASPPAHADPGAAQTIWTAWLPETFLTEQHGHSASYGEPRREVAESLWNLIRLGLMEPGGGLGGVTVLTVVTLTALGHAFLGATTTPEQRESHRPMAPAPGFPPTASG